MCFCFYYDCTFANWSIARLLYNIRVYYTVWACVYTLHRFERTIDTLFPTSAYVFVKSRVNTCDNRNDDLLLLPREVARSENRAIGNFTWSRINDKQPFLLVGKYCVWYYFFFIFKTISWATSAKFRSYVSLKDGVFPLCKMPTVSAHLRCFEIRR